MRTLYILHPMNIKGLTVIFSSIFLCVSFAGLQGQTTSAITADDLRLRMSILASDSLAGRRTGEIGCEKAARYIAGEFKRLGLQPLDS